MKKIMFLYSILVLFFSSCSKEEGPAKRPDFFFFDAKYGANKAVAHGADVYNSVFSRTIYEGPKYRASQEFDEMVLYVWPDYEGPYHLIFLFPATEPIVFSKKGNDITGEYRIRDTAITHFSVGNIYFHLVPGTDKLVIANTGEATEGSFAEGTMTFNASVESDTIPVPVTATFRLKKG